MGKAMMSGGMMFGEVVSLVDVARAPDEVDYVATDVVTHPKVSHIHTFGFAWLHGVVEETMANFVIRD